MNENENITTLWEDYRKGLDYQHKCGLSTNLPMFVDFYEGKQWPAATERTKNMPRPVINIIKMICRGKKAAILSVPVKIIYKSDSGADVSKFNSFAEYISKEIGQDELDKKAISSGVIKGSYFYHYYWDAEGRGMRGNRDGALRCEIIDPLNIFFANPQETDEQKQKWIMIATREETEAVIAKADKDVNKSLIVSDTNENGYEDKEQDGSNLCTVLTRYFRKGGEVYCEKATKGTIINKAFSITPDVESTLQAFENVKRDAPNNSLPDKPSGEGEKLRTPRGGSYLYPIVAGSYEAKEKSIYGLGEVEGIIPNQKAINFNLGMMLLNAQQTAWGKYVVLPGALKGQQISNEPGQVLVDWSKTGNGIRKLTEQGMQTQPLQLIDSITTLTRSMTGATEVMSGETIGANMSGSAIAQLQSQAQRPIEELRNTFWLVKKKQGEVLSQFFKKFYYRKEFTYERDIAESNDKETVTDFFDSSDFEQTEVNVVVETMAGTNSSTAGDINALDTLLAKGAISPATYIKTYPDDAIGNKTEMLKALEEESKSEKAQMMQQIEQLTQAMQQREEMIKNLQAESEENKKTVESVTNVIRENEALQAQIAELYEKLRMLQREANNKIISANNAISGVRKQAETAKSDAKEFAEHIYKKEYAGNEQQSQTKTNTNAEMRAKKNDTRRN